MLSENVTRNPWAHATNPNFRGGQKVTLLESPGMIGMGVGKWRPSIFYRETEESIGGIHDIFIDIFT